MLGLRPKFPPTAVALGDGYATVVRLQRRGPRPKLAEWSKLELPLPAAGTDEFGEHLMPTEELRLRLDDLIAGIGKARRFSLVLPDSGVRSFFIELETAPASPRELRDIVMFKISKLASIEPEAAAVAYQRLRSRRGGGGHYIALLASKRMIAGYEGYFARRGAHLGNIENATLAVTNLFEPLLRSGADGEDFALARVERRHFSIALFREGVLTFIRTRNNNTEADIPAAVRQEMRVINLFAQDKLGSSGVKTVFIQGSASAAPEAAEQLRADGFRTTNLSLEELIDLPPLLRGRWEEQEIITTAIGAAARS